MGVDELFEFVGGDVLTASADGFGKPAVEGETAVGIDAAEITSV
jgi:hypothetical protein